MDLLSIIQESRFEKGQGSKSGRGKAKSGKKGVDASLSRLKVYPSIMAGLKNSGYGDEWTTKGSKRGYVTTRQKWGKSDKQRVGKRVAKGFSPGTIPSDAKTRKAYAKRTLLRHGKSNQKRLKGKEFWKSGYRGK